ncbi:MAG: hypothetical protein V3R25_09915 [Nitrosomonadaceae bacterium]
MAFKSNENEQARGFFWAPSGDDRQGGKSRETAKLLPQSAIDAAMLLVPPPSGPQPALVTASQGGATNVGFVLEEGIAFTAEESSFIVSQPVGVTMASSLACTFTTIVNLEGNSDCVLFDGLSRSAVNARFMGVNGSNGVGLNITGNCDDIFATISQITLVGAGSTGIAITAASPTPIDININTVLLDVDDTTFLDYNPVSPSDVAVIAVSSVVKNGATGTTGFVAREGILIVEVAGTIRADSALIVEDGATLEIFAAMIEGDIIVEAGGILKCRILTHPTGTITNNGTIDGVIDEVRYGTAVVSEPLSTVVYVDGGTTETDPNGSENQPFSTIQDALDSITDASVSKKYVIRLTPATYDEGATLTLKPFIALDSLGNNKNTLIDSNIEINVAGEYSIEDINVSLNIDADVAGLGATDLQFRNIEMLGNLAIDGDGAGNTTAIISGCRIGLSGNSLFIVNASAVVATTFVEVDVNIEADSGTLDGDGNAAKATFIACQFKGNVNINGSLQGRGTFISTLTDGTFTADGALISVIFDSSSFPQNQSFINGASFSLTSFAEGTAYDPSSSPLLSNNVQDALDEIANVDGLPLQRNIFISAASTAATQQPGATDTPLQIEFGPFQATTQFDLSVGGVITCNISGQYDFQLIFHVGRTGSAGFSEIFIRELINGAQVGQSAFTLIDDDDTVVPLEFFSHLSLVATDVVTFEVVRDSNGGNSGGLFEGDPTLGDWNDAPTASLIISQLSGTVEGENGDVVGPASSLDDEIVTYDGITGKLIKSLAGVTVDSGNFQRTTANADLILLNNGTGAVKLGPAGILGNFGAAGVATTTFSVATPLAGNAFVQFEHNGNAIGHVGYFNFLDTIKFTDVANDIGFHIESNGQISIGDRIDEPDFSAIIGSFSAPFGLPQLTTAQEGSITGRPRMIHYNSILETIRYYNLLAGEFQSLMSSPTSAQVGEIPTFAITQGHRLEANSDVSIVAGVMERITNNQGFRINRSGSGVVQLGAGAILGQFGAVEQTGNVTFSISTNDPVGSPLLSFEQNSNVKGIMGFVNSENIFGMTTADGGGVFVDGGRTFIGILPDSIPAGVACKIGSSGINTMMVPEIGQFVENALTGVQAMFHFNTSLDVLRYHDGVQFRTVAHTGVTAFFESGSNSADTSLTSVNTYVIMNHGGGLSMLEGTGWEVSPGDSNRMRWSGTGTWSGVCRCIFEIRNPSPLLVRNYDTRPFVNGVAEGQFWSLHNVSANNDDPRIIEYETRFTISPGQDFDTRIKIKSGGAGSAQGARIFNATYDFRRFQ